MPDIFKKVYFSHDVTEIQYDVLGYVSIVPMDYLAEVTQVAKSIFYVRDTSANFGYFNIQATEYKDASVLIDAIATYITVFEYTETPVEKIVLSASVDFSTTATYTIAIPTGFVFYCDEVGVIVNSASGVTIQPIVKMGISSDDDAYLAAGLTTGLTAANDRFKSDSAYINGEATSINATVITAATATELTGVFYFKGFYMKNTAALP